MWSQWIYGSVDSILGIPTFWLARVAKIIQFASGLFIVVEIVGQRRVDRFAQDIIEDTNIVLARIRVLAIARTLFLYFWYGVRYLFSNEEDQNYWFDKQEKMAKGSSVFTWLGVCTGVAFVEWWFWTTDSDPDIVGTCIMALYGIAAGILVLNIAFSILLSCLILSILYPTKLFLVASARIANAVLSRARLSRLFLIVSAVLFLVASIIDFAAS